MKIISVLEEARRLYGQGYAIHWLHPNSKRPIGEGWTPGPRKPWGELEKTYRPGCNVGVRLGTPSHLSGGYLTVIDVDVKSKDARHKKEAMAVVRKLINPKLFPMVKSGRGNGSRHYYCLSSKPFKAYDFDRSSELVKAFMPSEKHPSKRDKEHLTAEELQKGYRIRPAWEISIMSEGRQVVLPPSVHPDSGKPYTWARKLPLKAYPTFIPNEGQSTASTAITDAKIPSKGLNGFNIEPVELGWLPLSKEMHDAITKGTHVADRSAFLMKAATALFAAKLNRNEVLTVLTDPANFLGECAYDHAKTKDRKRAADWLYRYTVQHIEAERSPDIFGAPVAAKKLTPKEMEAQAAEIKSDRHWSEDLVTSKHGIPLNLVGNVVTILTNDVAKNAIRRDEFAFRDAYSVDTPWGGKKGQHVSDDDVARIKYWLGKAHQFEPSSNTISEALIVTACENAFDPVRDFLDALPEWDGTQRLDSWLKDNFEAQGEPEYLAQVFRKWMVAMVMRIYQPGAKFDWMPIFEGPQNVGKSSFGRILVGEKYFLDWLPNLSDKDSALALQGMWGVEFGELTQFRKNELEIIKAFVSRTVDKVRPPYGRRMQEHERRCVFFGTTNKETYLIDETGNRRFKPVVVGALNFKQLKKDRLQLFAEAKHLWREKIETSVTLDLTGKAREFELKIHAEKMVADDSDAMREMMEDFIQKIKNNEVVFDLKKFRILDLFQGVGCLARWRADNRNFQFSAKMLKKMGAVQYRLHGFRYWKF